MTARRDEPLRFPANRDKLIARAIAADEGNVSVGGLAARVGMLRELPDARSRSATVAPHGIDALARLVQLARREQTLTPEQFATRFSLDLRELLDLESARNVPEPRLLYQLSLALRVSYEKLLVLAGHRVRRDEALEREALRFAASSGPMDKLSKSEAQALHDFIRALDE
jgi:transcriptional regulator with XRE-family HTH domain